MKLILTPLHHALRALRRGVENAKCGSKEEDKDIVRANKDIVRANKDIVHVGTTLLS